MDRPELLLEDYNEALVCGLLFNSEPRSVLMIGLGGCSLVHFLLKALPGCVLDVVEIRQAVIDLAKEYFLLPTQHPHLRIFHASGTGFFERPGAQPGNYDMIIVDAFDDAGPAVSLLKQDFLSACRAYMSEEGVFVINLWNGPGHDFTVLYRSIQEAFGNNALKLLLSESYRNAVAFGFKGPAIGCDLNARRSLAADLQTKHKINFAKYLKQLYWQNFNEQEQ
jgi:spermidine synthase